jgi:hypothetical protein
VHLVHVGDALRDRGQLAVEFGAQLLLVCLGARVFVLRSPVGGGFVGLLRNRVGLGRVDMAMQINTENRRARRVKRTGVILATSPRRLVALRKIGFRSPLLTNKKRNSKLAVSKRGELKVHLSGRMSAKLKTLLTEALCFLLRCSQGPSPQPPP